MAHILVVDDEQPIRNMLTQILERAGHTVVLAEDGVVALEKYRQQAADLIITDLMMANKNGLELIQEINREFGDVKMIAISGGMLNSPSDYYLSVAKLMGANKIIEKPFTRDELVEAVNKMLGGCRT